MTTQTYEVDIGGKTYEVDAPDETTAWKWANQTHNQYSQTENIGAGSAPSSMPWSKVAGGAAVNFLPSAWNMVKDIGEAISSPIETTKGIGNLFTGIVQSALPEEFQAASAADQRRMAATVGKYYVDRYGSIEGFKQALAKDPAGVLADVSTVFSGGAGLARTAGMQGAGQVLASASRAVDPLLQTVRGAEAIARPTGNIVASVIGGLGTHTGGESIRQMAQAGFEGGAKAKSAADAMRGKTSLEDILSEAQMAAGKIAEERGASYSADMAKIGQNQKVIPFSNIDKAVDDAFKTGTYQPAFNTNAQRVSISPTTAEVKVKIQEAIDNWKSLGSDYHTAAGLDALKRTIGDIRDAQPINTPSSKIASDVYSAIRKEIIKADSTYANTMKSYEEMSRTLDELRRHVTGNDRGSAITAANKLQKILSGNNEMKIALLKKLEDAGAPNLMAGLAGLSMSSGVPVSLLGKGGMGLGTMAVLMNNPAFALPFAAIQSPRLVGEAALATGRGAGIASRAVNKGRGMLGSISGQTPYDLYLYQLNQLNQKGQPGMLYGEQQ